MKTYDDYANDYEKEVAEYEEDYYGNNNYNYEKKRNIIIKVIIIIVCVILLIWLFSLLLKSNRNIKYDEKLHMENVTKVRLASERYFFIDNNLPIDGEVKQINLKTLVDKKLIDDIVDANNKVCSDDKTKISLTKNSTYVLRINLSCSTLENEEIYFYDLNNYACKNCDGNTYMDGKSNVPQKEDNNNSKEEVIETGYSCKEWSKWQSEREVDPSLIERVRVFVKGVKKGNTSTVKTYGEWSDYILNPILEEDNIEVEKTEKIETKWSDNKETTNYIENSDKVRVVDKRVSGGGSSSYCSSGYSKSGNICVSNKIYTADLTPSQYNSYHVINKPCNDSVTEKINGKFVLVRKGCKYRLTDSLKTSSNPSVTTYIYQELEEYPVTYYRYRTVTIENVSEDDVYTTDYYEEDKLPEGYEKVPGSEKIEYSYKVKVCEK